MSYVQVMHEVHLWSQDCHVLFYWSVITSKGEEEWNKGFFPYFFTCSLWILSYFKVNLAQGKKTNRSARTTTTTAISSSFLVMPPICCYATQLVVQIKTLLSSQVVDNNFRKDRESTNCNSRDRNETGMKQRWSLFFACLVSSITETVMPIKYIKAKSHPFCTLACPSLQWQSWCCCALLVLIWRVLVLLQEAHSVKWGENDKF